MPRSLVLALVLARAAACANAPAPAPEPASPAVVVTPSPREPAPEPTAAWAQESEPPAESVGIPACDEYLKLYRDCEPKLARAIAEGNRRA